MPCRRSYKVMIVQKREVREENGGILCFLFVLNRIRTRGINEASLIMSIVVWVVIPSFIHPIFHPRMVTFMGVMSRSLPMTLFAGIFWTVAFNVSDLLAAITFLHISCVRSRWWAGGSEWNGHKYIRYFCSGYKGGVSGD